MAYYRVSTAQQGHSGLGLEAQQEAVSRYLNGAKLLAAYTEIESGTNDDRPELAKALAHCKRTGATLLIAKLDRLGRRLAKLAELLDKAPFVCCDMPKADKTTLQMLAVFAEHEARAIGERTRAALAAAKARGVKLGGRRAGSPALTDAMRAQSLKVRLERADEFAADVSLQLAELKAEGATSLAQLASGLNARGIVTSRGKTWTPAAVARVLKRVH